MAILLLNLSNGFCQSDDLSDLLNNEKNQYTGRV